MSANGTGGAAPKRRGDAFERAVVAYLRANGFPYAERAYGAGRPDDRGDIDGVPGFVIQCRATRRFELSEALQDATEQALGGELPVVVFKRRQHSTGGAYVVTNLETFTLIAREALDMRAYEIIRIDGLWHVIARRLDGPDTYDTIARYPGTRAGLLEARKAVVDIQTRQTALEEDE